MLGARATHFPSFDLIFLDLKIRVGLSVPRMQELV